MNPDLRRLQFTNSTFDAVQENFRIFFDFEFGRRTLDFFAHFLGRLRVHRNTLRRCPFKECIPNCRSSQHTAMRTTCIVISPMLNTHAFTFYVATQLVRRDTFYFRWCRKSIPSEYNTSTPILLRVVTHSYAIVGNVAYPMRTPS